MKNSDALPEADHKKTTLTATELKELREKVSEPAISERERRVRVEAYLRGELLGSNKRREKALKAERRKLRAEYGKALEGARKDSRRTKQTLQAAGSTEEERIAQLGTIIFHPTGPLLKLASDIDLDQELRLPPCLESVRLSFSSDEEDRDDSGSQSIEADNDWSTESVGHDCVDGEFSVDDGASDIDYGAVPPPALGTTVLEAVAEDEQPTPQDHMERAMDLADLWEKKLGC